MNPRPASDFESQISNFGFDTADSKLQIRYFRFELGKIPRPWQKMNLNPSPLPLHSRRQRVFSIATLMKMANIETWPINIPYTHVERSSLVDRAGVSDIVVKVTADNGLVGWGESSRVADVFGIEAARRAIASTTVITSATARTWKQSARNAPTASPRGSASST
jgi:hypothetical protein